MSEMLPLVDGARVSGCTLPTAQQPLRLAEFDELFAPSVTRWTGSIRCSISRAAKGTYAAFREA